jgi:hypothetical protein
MSKIRIGNVKAVEIGELVRETEDCKNFAFKSSVRSELELKKDIGIFEKSVQN